VDAIQYRLAGIQFRRERARNDDEPVTAVIKEYLGRGGPIYLRIIWRRRARF